MSQVQRPTLTLWLIITYMMVAQLTDTLYLPAMPVISSEFETTSGSVQWILALFLFSFGLSQFIYGPLSDFYGRRPIVLVSLIVYLIGAIAATFSQTMTALLGANLVLGLGVGCSGLMCRTVVRDLYSGPKIQSASAIVGIAAVLMPIGAQVLGAYILKYFGWRADFFVLMMVAFILFAVMCRILEESNPYIQQYPMTLKLVASQYKEVLSNPWFLGNLLASTFSLACIMAYHAVAPYMFQIHLGFTPVAYAWVALFPILGYLSGCIYSGYAIRTLSNKTISHIGNITSCLGAFGLMVPIMIEHQSALSIVLPMMFFFFGNGVVFSSTMAGALMPFGRLAGVAGASLGGLMNTGAGLSVMFISYFEIDHVKELSFFIFICSLLGFLSYIIFTNKTDSEALLARASGR